MQRLVVVLFWVFLLAVGQFYLRLTWAIWRRGGVARVTWLPRFR